MIASTQITNTEIFALIFVPVSKLSAVKFCLRKDSRNCLKVGYFLRKQQNALVNYFKIIND